MVLATSVALMVVRLVLKYINHCTMSSAIIVSISLSETGPIKCLTFAHKCTLAL